MCLSIKHDSVLKIAEEDIIVYKFLVEENTPLKKFPSAKPFKGVIKGIPCEGMILSQLWGHKIRKTRIFFCTNDSRLGGLPADYKGDYKYSWAWDDSVSSIIVDGEEYISSILKTPFKRCRVEIGKTYTSELIRKLGSIEIGIHSMVNLEDAKEISQSFVVFAECVIPKGSEYYEGTFWDKPSIASNKLIYKRIINVPKTSDR